MIRPGGGARAVALASDDVPRAGEKSPVERVRFLPGRTEQDQLPVLATGELNRGRSPSGDGDARTIDIIVVVRIRVRNLDRPTRKE
jgi:hypothetical protein